MALVGKDKVLKSLSKEITKIKGRTKKGLLAAAYYIKLKSQEKTPVDHGLLKASHYVSDGEQGFFSKNIIAEIGIGGTGAVSEDQFDASAVNLENAAELGASVNYAIYVHEDLNAEHAHGQAKFLENAMKESQDKILEIVRNRAKVR